MSSIYKLGNGILSFEIINTSDNTTQLSARFLSHETGVVYKIKKSVIEIHKLFIFDPVLIYEVIAKKPTVVEHRDVADMTWIVSVLNHAYFITVTLDTASYDYENDAKLSTKFDGMTAYPTNLDNQITSTLIQNIALLKQTIKLIKKNDKLFNGCLIQVSDTVHMKIDIASATYTEILEIWNKNKRLPVFISSLIAKGFDFAKTDQFGNAIFGTTFYNPAEMNIFKLLLIKGFYPNAKDINTIKQVSKNDLIEPINKKLTNHLGEICYMLKLPEF